MIFTSDKFYILLFAGFIGYILWGVILEYIISGKQKGEHLKMKVSQIQDEISSLIQEKEYSRENHKKMLEYKLEGIKKIDSDGEKNRAEIERLRNKKNDLARRKNSVSTQIPLPKYQIKSDVGDYLKGWMNYIAQNEEEDTREEKLEECERYAKEFLDELFASEDYYVYNN